ncbi:hypothetical protein AVEN_5219-1 [Araneus ventricosus]|uniref:Tc1-like transposase DDE domain-containing protein n=1 Tax=Araneus ventricosus TaxID=182803 RepID=A0A4Y2I358_ARAVE|nr:hypothetical protein AVEN_5219-1 [Araneus ventricosus]
MNIFFPNGTGIFPDDNDKTLRALIIQNRFRVYEDSFCRMNCSPQSSYLNLIENLWDVLEERLWDVSFLPSSVQCLGGKLLKFWTTISSEALQNPIETISRGMLALCRAKGGPTKY